MPAIKGQVAAERETQIGAVTVELINPTGDIVDQVQTNADGSFALHVSQGTWKLRAYDPQGQRDEVTVSIDNDDIPAELNLT